MVSKDAILLLRAFVLELANVVWMQISAVLSKAFGSVRAKLWMREGTFGISTKSLLRSKFTLDRRIILHLNTLGIALFGTNSPSINCHQDLQTIN